MTEIYSERIDHEIELKKLNVTQHLGVQVHLSKYLTWKFMQVSNVITNNSCTYLI